MASRVGFTGKSILHRLHALYKFDVLNDMVFDAMHTILLGNVKRHLDFYKDSGYLQAADLEKRLNKMPWTAGSYAVFICDRLCEKGSYSLSNCTCLTIHNLTCEYGTSTNFGHFTLLT